MPRNDHSLARLLSGRPSLSRPEKEEILDAVLGQVDAAPQQESQRRGFFGVLVAMAAAAAAFAVVSLPPRADPSSGEVVARGARLGPQLTAVCAATSIPGSCRVGGELLLELADARRWTHVAVFAFREDDTVIWYTPEHSAPLEHSGEILLLPQRVKLGPEHPPGRYDVAAVLSTRTLDRAAVRRIYDNPERFADATIIETEVHVR